MFRWIVKEKDQGIIARFVLPILSICGSIFMVVACILSHKMGCVWYLIVFTVIITIGLLVNKFRKKAS